MFRIKIDRSRCIGCLTCVTACVVSHETESGDARNRITIDREINQHQFSVATVIAQNVFTHV